MPIINIYLKKTNMSSTLNKYYYYVPTCVFQISKINHEYSNNAVIHEWKQAHEWIAVVQLPVIYFWYLESKSSYTFYYVHRLHKLWRFKKDFVFHYQMLNDIFDCDATLK